MPRCAGMTTPSPQTRTFTTIGVIGLGTMGAGIAEVFARNGYAVVGVEKDDDGAGPRPPAPRALHRPRGEAREDDRGRAGRAARPDHVLHLAQGPRRRRPRRRGGRGVARDQEGALPRARRDRLAGHRPRHQHLVPVGHRDLDRELPPGPRHRRALLQPGAGAEPGRDRPHRRHRGPGARRRARRWSRRSARTPSSAATRPASSPTPCCSATSTTRSRCTRAATPAARTSTPRCASAAATRWARWRCST